MITILFIVYIVIPVVACVASILVALIVGLASAGASCPETEAGSRHLGTTCTDKTYKLDY